MIFMTTKANNVVTIRSLHIHRAMCHAIRAQEIFKRWIVFVTVENFRVRVRHLIQSFCLCVCVCFFKETPESFNLPFFTQKSYYGYL